MPFVPVPAIWLCLGYGVGLPPARSLLSTTTTAGFPVAGVLASPGAGADALDAAGAAVSAWDAAEVAAGVGAPRPSRSCLILLTNSSRWSRRLRSVAIQYC